jgi:hypothetical protein
MATGIKGEVCMLFCIFKLHNYFLLFSLKKNKQTTCVLVLPLTQAFVIFFILYFLLFLAVVGFKLRASCLQGRHSATRTTPPATYYFLIFLSHSNFDKVLLLTQP